ncbi:kinesin-like protein KIF26B isoform X2 [Mobula birostris]|uniref:kinesin-like protein KIF26B isoform X2 n=1 Tax=Mobula birostris TaxID=1983395 RepID=UPI003B27F43C
MNSVSTSKERAAFARNRKHVGSAESYSPTKLASFAPEIWSRKGFQMYEDSRVAHRPAPEGAGSVPGSGTASPASSTGSPGSSGGSPGSLAGSSPGSSSTGSPGSGTGSLGSGGSDDKGIWCESCNTRLVELKRQALKMMVPGAFPSKDPALSALIHDKLQVPNTTRRAWNDRDNRCDVCATHLNQLKQEALQMVQTLQQAASLEPLEPSPGSPPPPSSIPSLVGSRNGGSLPPPREWAFIPTAYASSNAYAGLLSNKHAGKPNSLGLGAEKKGGTSGHPVSKGGLHVPTSPSNGNILSSVTIQAHQYLEGAWSVSRSNGVTLYPYPISQLMSDNCREGLTEAVLNRYNSDKPSVYSFSGSQSTYVTSVASSGTSAAASFFVRAAQKLNLSSKKKKHHRPPAPNVSEPLPFPTNFSGILQTSSPPAPPCLLRAISKVKDNPGIGKVKVMLRICPASMGDLSESSCFFKVDPRKKQITLYDPPVNGLQNPSQKRGCLVPPKMFAFDAVFPQDSSQAEVCAGTVAEVIQSVVNGADGCVFCFGHTKLGKSYTMIGRDDSMQNLGIIPCAISWLFKLINERKEKTGARFSVRVSAVEVWGKEENLKDLLSEVATGSLQDGQSPGVYLCEDPICGMQLQNQSELRAPTPEKAAYFLDAAIASRRSSRSGCDEEELRNSHMLFTLHIYQYRMEKSGKAGMSGGRSRLHLIDLGSCVKVLSKSREGGSGLCLSLSALGNVILALVNGTKHIPYKESKLTMLLRESLGNLNCRTTMIAHISSSSSHYSETLSTIQIASRVLRMKKKKTKYTSSSSGGESSCEEGRMRRPTQLRPFHPRAGADPDLPMLNLAGEPDYSSSSEQSCDTVIYVGPNGAALSDKELTDNEGPPEFVPIIPSLQRARKEAGPEGGAEGDCLKCNTFAELQERLECIDGSEEPTKFPFEEGPGSQNPAGHGEAEAPQRLAREVSEEPVQTRPQAGSALAGGPSAPPSPGSQSGASRGQGAREGSDPKPRPAGSPRLGVASLSKTADYKPQPSPSQRCKVYTQKGSLPSPAPPPPPPPPPPPQPEARASPVGMSPQAAKRPAAEPEVAVQQRPLELNGEDELVFTLVEGLVASSALGGGRPTSIASLDSDCSVRALPSGSRPVSIISSLHEELEGSLPTSLSQLSLAQFLPFDEPSPEGEEGGTVPGSRRSSISSWLSEMSTGSDGEQSCHSFVAQGGEGQAQPRLPALETGDVSGPQDEGPAHAQSGKFSIMDRFLRLREKGSEAGGSHQVAAGSRGVTGSPGRATGCSSSPLGLAAHQGCSPPQTEVPVYPSISPKPSDSNEEGGSSQEPSPAPSRASGGEPEGDQASSGARFEDPWLKREVEEEQEDEEEEGVSGLEGSHSSETNQDKVQGWVGSGDWSGGRVADGCEMALSPSPSQASVLSAEGGSGGSQAPTPPGLRNDIEAPAPSGHRDDIEASAQSCRHDNAEAAAQPSHHDDAELLSQTCCRDDTEAPAWSSCRDDAEAPAPRTPCLGTESSASPSQATTPCSPRTTLECRLGSPKHGMLPKPKGMPPLPPVRKSSLDQRNRASPQHLPSAPPQTGILDDWNPKAKNPAADAGGKGSSGKGELASSRTSSLNRRGTGHYDCLSLERLGSLSPGGPKLGAGRDSTMPRTGRSLNRAGPGPSSPTHTGPASSPKPGPSKMSAVSRLLLAGPKCRSLSASSTKTLSFSTKSLPQSVGRSPSMPSHSRNMSWSTQSLSSKQSRGASGLVAKLPLRAVNGRISELLQGGSSLWAQQTPGGGGGEPEGQSPDKAAPPPPQALPSPYSKVTPPRRPHRCSSGHASDNSSVLSGELPPAMGKTALFYHSGGSSGYESMMRDSEATGSASSAQDSTSENGNSVPGRCRSLKAPKKRTTAGSQRRRLLPGPSSEAAPIARKPAGSSGLRWVDLRPVQRGMAEPFEIKVYEIDDVERLQRRRAADNKLRGFICFNAKLKIPENRQQRISEVKTKYNVLMQELEATKQRLMLEPSKWIIDLDQGFEVDSLEYLEALECVTERLEHRVNFCKAHLMMITCFDIACGRR